MQKENLKRKRPEIYSKSGLIGYLQGSIKGVINTLEWACEDRDSHSEAFTTYQIKSLVSSLKSVLEESEEIWENVKHQ